MEQIPLSSGVSTNSTTTMSNSLFSNTSDFVTAFAFVIVMCFTLFGNLLIILVVVRNKTSRLYLPSHCHVVSLALGNLLMAASVLPVRIVSFLNKPAWIEQHHLCEVYSSMFVFCCTVTVFALALMTLDRYFSIPRSGTYSKLLTPCRAFGLIVIAWLLALALSFGPAELGKEMAKPRWDCKLSRIYSRPFIYCFVTVEVLLPVVLMLVLHCRITQARMNHFRSVDISGKNVKNLDYSDAPTISQEASWAQVVIKILFSFIFFWIPRCIFLLLDNSQHNSIHEIADGVTEILTYCFGASLAILLGNFCTDYKYEMTLILCPFMWYQRREHRRRYQVNQNKVTPGVTPSTMYRRYSTNSSNSPLYPL